ncbi:MAG: fumarylacetoacetate hydrolase family protein [Candidatus Krumholzibacteria bacterium]|nr:fumarylacetoacetate hydrolase family protein [Candidatus Krumholzibacteria bacterium]
MKLVNFKQAGPRAGALIGDRVLDLAAAAPFLPDTVDSILCRGILQQIRNIVDNAAEIDRAHFLPASSLELYPPVLRPGKIVCLGLNYAGHAREQGREPPDHPIIFAKAPTALTGPYDDIVIRPGVEQVDAEAELAVIVGREGTMIPEDEARGYIAGFAAFNDVSARRIQRGDKQWFRGKSFDTFAPCGPCLVTPDEIGDNAGLRIVQRLNGAVVQESTTADMIFGVERIVSFISSAMTLMPGDIIATGTPAGVGLYRDPQVFLGDGDVVEVEIERIGLLRNRVRAPERD